MNLLAIETSTDACSVGLSVNDELILDHRLAAQQHGTLVLPMVDALMAKAELTPQQLDGVVFGRGPGSFTGVRIGVAVAQGIALGADVGVAGISTLQSVAQGCSRVHGDWHVAVSLDARMDEVYFAAFARDEKGLMMPITEEVVLPPTALAALPETHAWHWAGSGAERYASLLRERFTVDETTLRTDCWPQAMDLLTLAMPMAAAGTLVPPEQASPVYLRDKVAQTTAERAAR